MKVRITPFTVEIDPELWRKNFGEQTPTQIRADLQAATEEWVNNYVADLARLAGQQ